MDVSTRHAEDLVTGIPGYAYDFSSLHYSGYVTVDERHGRHLYYYFATSERDPENDPVVLWLNGGPGCSSFDGFVYEHGPFKFQFDERKGGEGGLVLTPNEHAWNQVANMIYLDSPAGVGLSYSETQSDYITNDTHTARDSHRFLQRFFDKYEEFAKNPFFIVGESYAGVYVPTLAQVVQGSNEAADSHRRINLQGYAVGNGVCDQQIDGNAIMPFAFGKALLSTELYRSLHRSCNGQFWNASYDSECGRLLDEAYDDLRGINIYNILEPCYHKGAEQDGALQQAQQAQHGSRSWPFTGSVKPGLVPNWAHLLGELGHTPPCLESREMWAFLNDDDVRAALHAKPMHIAGRFDECSDRITYSHNMGSMLPIHAELVSKGLQALIYSGDHDMCVPHTGSEAWTRSLNLPVRERWRPWLAGKSQISGYVQEYEGLKFATIRGAGHMVPQTKPKEALALISRFLEGRRL
ncbi:hypothetical protein WJX72_006650 [[Myrmecia] bisecta]|uniref:Carboxypeptidase n=1 Tax=[Myrmecia] bisecta TaxID=41462 RepID=A0AAW1PAV5_9CHLO